MIQIDVSDMRLEAICKTYIFIWNLYYIFFDSCDFVLAGMYTPLLRLLLYGIL